MRAWSGRLVRLRRTRVPSGVASSADRARARRRQRFFFTFREQQRVATHESRHLRSSVSRNAAIAARPVAVSYATSAVECFVALASYGTQSPKSASRRREKRNRSSNRRLFFLSFPGELFFPTSVSLCEGHFRGVIFLVPAYASAVSSFRASCPEYLWSWRQRSRNAGSAFDSTRARTTAHTHRRR